MNLYKGIDFVSATVAVDSSDMAVSSSASWSRFCPPSNFVNGHVSTMWFMVCCWPQSQEGDWARPHLCKLAWHGPWPVWKQFRRSKPGCWIVESVTNGVVDHRSRLPILSPLRNCVDRCHVWSYWALRCKRVGGCSKTSTYTGQFGWAPVIWSILSVVVLWHREGGATLLSTGSHESCVGCRQPEIRRIELWSSEGQTGVSVIMSYL